MEEYASNPVKRNVNELLCKLSQMSDVGKQYQRTFDALKSFHQCYNTNEAPFIEGLNYKNQDTILFDGVAKEIANTSLPLQQRIKTLLSFSKKLLKENRKKDLTYAINAINVYVKEQLYRQCMNKLADDNKCYRWSYTEWAFLWNAQFQLRSDGRMSIPLANNQGYQRYYAPGMQYHEIFQREIEHFAKCADLEIAIDSNFKNEIIFTKECSHKLQNMGFHLNLDYIKQLIHHKHIYESFRHGHIRHDKHHSFLIAKGVPRVITNLIWDISTDLDVNAKQFIRESVMNRW